MNLTETAIEQATVKVKQARVQPHEVREVRAEAEQAACAARLDDTDMHAALQTGTAFERALVRVCQASGNSACSLVTAAVAPDLEHAYVLHWRVPITA